MDYSSIKEQNVEGRYIVLEDIIQFFENTSTICLVETIGFSVLERPIKLVTLGSGPKKILMWSQMHGNESTTTKAVIDLINLLGTDSRLGNSIKENCTIKIIPMLNPDGAAAYTRVNANHIDLNRDAQDRTQPESNLLRKVYDDFKPDYCLNLHDQRTIFSAGKAPKPATVSFLAPAHDEGRSISESRVVSMKIIAAMNKVLQKLIPNQVGRYDDAFNGNCVGDAFQMLNSPTILIEAGHFPNDYQRERTREYIYTSLVEALNVIANDLIVKYDKADYFAIPENNKLFFDILILNAHILNDQYEKGMAIGILFREVLDEGAVSFEPLIEKVDDLDDHYGHKTFNCLNTPDLELLRNHKEIVKLTS